MPETEMDEGDAIDELTTTIEPPATPLSAVTISTSSSSSKPASRWKKYLALVSVCLVLLLVASVGAGFVLHARGNGSAPATSLKHSTPVVSPTSVPVTYPYPPLAASYSGSVADVMTGQHTALLLTGIQQSQGNIQGSFEGLGLSGSFRGMVTPSGQVQFTVKVYTGSMALAFEGSIKVGGDIVGTFTVVNQQGQGTGETGIWNVSPKQ